MPVDILQKPKDGTVALNTQYSLNYNALGETKVIQHIYGKLLYSRNKIDVSKRVLILITLLVILLNLFTLFYYFENSKLIFKLSILFIICYIVFTYLYINYLKATVKN